jgi:hypothetical protein
MPTDLATAAMERLDHVARQIEHKWGVDRLERLVPPELRVRFERQRDLLRQAMLTGEANVVAAQAEGMSRAWQALDKAATAGGAEPLAVTVWECRSPDTGGVIALVRTGAEARLVAKGREVWMLEEVALLIERLGKSFRQARAAFPGAQLVDLRPAEAGHGQQPRREGRDSRRERAALDALHRLGDPDLDDAIPFEVPLALQ